jgi:2-C-methyl-D-erythritol 4-phosphate cytidylyltransferase
MGGVKKEYQKLEGIKGSPTVLQAAVSAFASVPSVGTIVITVPEGGEAAARQALPNELLSSQKPKLLFVTGGKTRCNSVFNALLLLETYSPDYVLIHDGARPFVSPRLIESIIEAVKIHDAVVPLVPLSDTPKQCFASLWDRPWTETRKVYIKRHLERSHTGLAQTPQGFAFPALLRAYKEAASPYCEGTEFTDDAEVWGSISINRPVAVIPGSEENRKITYLQDITRPCSPGA